jgi:hypothetical protein
VALVSAYDTSTCSKRCGKSTYLLRAIVPFEVLKSECGTSEYHFLDFLPVVLLVRPEPVGPQFKRRDSKRPHVRRLRVPVRVQIKSPMHECICVCTHVCMRALIVPAKTEVTFKILTQRKRESARESAEYSEFGAVALVTLQQTSKNFAVFADVNTAQDWRRVERQL